MTPLFPHPPSSAEHAARPPFPPHHQHEARLPPPPPRPSPRPRSHSFPGSDHGVIERDILLHILYGRGYGPHLRGLRERAGMRGGGHLRGMRGERGGRFGGPGPLKGSPYDFMEGMGSADGEGHLHRRHTHIRGGHHAHESMRHPPLGDVFGVEHGVFHTRCRLASSNQPRHHHRSYLKGDRYGAFLAGEDRNEPISSFSESDEEGGDYVQVSTSPSVSDEEGKEAPRGHKRATVAEKKAGMDAIAEQLANMMHPEEGKEQETNRHHQLHRGPRSHQHRPLGGTDDHHRPSHRAHPPHPPRLHLHHRHSDEHHTHPGTHHFQGHPPPPPPPPHHHRHHNQHHAGPIRSSHPTLGKVHTSRHHHPRLPTDDRQHICHMGGGRRQAEHLGKQPGRSMHPGDKEDFDIASYLGPDSDLSHRCRRGRSHQVRFGLQ